MSHQSASYIHTSPTHDAIKRIFTLVYAICPRNMSDLLPLSKPTLIIYETDFRGTFFFRSEGRGGIEYFENVFTGDPSTGLLLSLTPPFRYYAATSEALPFFAGAAFSFLYFFVNLSRSVNIGKMKVNTAKSDSESLYRSRNELIRDDALTGIVLLCVVEKFRSHLFTRAIVTMI